MKRRDFLMTATGTAAGASAMLSWAQDLRYGHPKVDAYRRPEDPGGRPLALVYNDRVRDMLLWIRETQSENILEAAHAIARTRMRGGTCWYSWDQGHAIIFDMVPYRNGLPELFTVGYRPGEMRDGDLLLGNMLDPTPELNEKDITVVSAPIPWSSDARNSRLITHPGAMRSMRPYADIWIETNIDTVGGIIDVPGMPPPTGPVSGIIGITVFWMMVADACRILAREGVTVPVGGDEPSPAADAVNVMNLYDPLMDDWFERLMLQIEMIGAALGDMDRVAAMAVDSVLRGGRVWCYGRDRVAIPLEAQTRRGGLALTRGIYDRDGALVDFHGPFAPGPEDCVIMGVFRPDDPLDLMHLDEFRRLGLPVASIGPMTRDMLVPEGRTVPKETDIHVGRMCDTYGLYALPGFGRRVCPTSGAMLMQMFWGTCMQTMEEVVRRTGNVPDVFWSAAIRNGAREYSRMNELWENGRGY